jgi:hypothetical protein
LARSSAAFRRSALVDEGLCFRLDHVALRQDLDRRHDLAALAIVERAVGGSRHVAGLYRRAKHAAWRGTLSSLRTVSANRASSLVGFFDMGRSLTGC